MIRDDQLIATIAAQLHVGAVVCGGADLFSEDEMKLYDVFNRWDNALLGQVWAATADDAQAVAQAEYDGDVYVLLATVEAK